MRDRLLQSALLAFLCAPALGIPSGGLCAATAPRSAQVAGDPYAGDIAAAEKRFGIPATWLRAIIRIESGGNPRAISPKGATGLMQIMPSTWASLRLRYGLGRDPFNPHDNILAGAALLREMRDRYGSPGFLAAYNAGPGRYEDYRDRHHPLPAETIAYVADLLPRLDLDAGQLATLTSGTARPALVRSSLFVALSGDTEPIDPASSKPPTDKTPIATRVRDMSAIAPQGDSLFVARSTARQNP
jgi:hypothetical protein